MKIESDMNLDHLSEYMGDGSRKYAAKMRRILVKKFDGLDISDVSEKDWLDLLDKAVDES